MQRRFNREDQKQLRQSLRGRMTHAEKILWYYLRKRFVKDFKFRRQYGVGPYIVDFYCPRACLAIEVDGDSHYQTGARERDLHKQKFIEEHGIRVLRFTDNDVKDSTEHVIEIIKQNLCTPSKKVSSPARSFPPLPEGGYGGVGGRGGSTPSHSPSERGRKLSGGFATLIAVLIVGAVGVAVTVSLLLLGLGASRTSFAQEQSYQTKALADACAEEALQQISDSLPFTGSGTLTLGQGSCNYTVTSQGSQNRTITASGTVATMTRRVRVIISQIRPSINVTSWQEVADF